MTEASDGPPVGRRLVLACPDGPRVGAVTEGLRRAGHTVACTDSGRDAARMTRATLPDLVILHRSLEDRDGFAVCRELRSENLTMPVIVLMDRDVADERIRGLHLGADDCVNQDSAVEELVLRVAAVLRRSRTDPADQHLRCRHVVLDARGHRVSVDGRWIHLKPTEFRLLHFFLRNLDTDLHRSVLIEALWGERFSGDYGLLALAVSSLRKKIEVDQPKLIQTVRGVGYRMSEAPNIRLSA